MLAPKRTSQIISNKYKGAVIVQLSSACRQACMRLPTPVKHCAQTAVMTRVRVALTIILTLQWEAGIDRGCTCGGDGEELRNDVDGGGLNAHPLSHCAYETGC